MPERLGDVRRVNGEIEELIWCEAGVGEVDSLDGGVEGVLEEADEGDVAHGTDVVVGSGGVGREIDVGGIQRSIVGPGSEDSLVEDTVLNGGIESLNTPMQRAFCRTRHDVTAYSTRRIVTAVKDDTSECQNGIRDALEQSLFRIWTREVWVRETRDHGGIVAPKGLVPLQCHDAHIGGFPIITRKSLGG